MLRVAEGPTVDGIVQQACAQASEHLPSVFHSSNPIWVLLDCAPLTHTVYTLCLPVVRNESFPFAPSFDEVNIGNAGPRRFSHVVDNDNLQATLGSCNSL